MPFINNSDKILRAYIERSSKDTIIEGYNNPMLSGREYTRSSPHSNNKGYFTSRSCFEGAYHPYIRIYIFDEEVLLATSWNEIIANYMILQRYDLTIKDLQTLNWQIPYPPTEVMKDMKMYPAYDSGK
jgi:hypothetical protein